MFPQCSRAIKLKLKDFLGILFLEDLRKGGGTGTDYDCPLTRVGVGDERKRQASCVLDEQGCPSLERSWFCKEQGLKHSDSESQRRQAKLEGGCMTMH